MPRISFPSLPRFDLGGGAGKRPPISSRPPPELPSTRPPSSKPGLDDVNAKPTTRTPDDPDAPVLKPDTDAPSTKLNPEPTKPSLMNNLRNTLLVGGGLTGAGLFAAGGFGNNALNAGASVANAAIIADAIKEMFQTAVDGIGEFTKNPVNLAIVAGVIGVVLLR